MGDFTITQWRCDCCGIVLPKRPSVGYPRITIVAHGEGEWASEGNVRWHEPCEPCNTAAGNYLKDMMAYAQRRARETP